MDFKKVIIILFLVFVSFCGSSARQAESLESSILKLANHNLDLISQIKDSCSDAFSLMADLGEMPDSVFTKNELELRKELSYEIEIWDGVFNAECYLLKLITLSVERRLFAEEYEIWFANLQKMKDAREKNLVAIKSVNLRLRAFHNKVIARINS